MSLTRRPTDLARTAPTERSVCSGGGLTGWLSPCAGSEFFSRPPLGCPHPRRERFDARRRLLTASVKGCRVVSYEVTRAYGGRDWAPAFNFSQAVTICRPRRGAQTLVMVNRAVCSPEKRRPMVAGSSEPAQWKLLPPHGVLNQFQGVEQALRTQRVLRAPMVVRLGAFGVDTGLSYSVMGRFSMYSEVLRAAVP